MRTQIATLVVATSIVQLANGFFNTLVSLRVAAENFDMAGIVLSAYFGGFTVGALGCGRLIQRIGHIRTYAAFGGLVAAATAIMPLLVDSLPWVVPRALVGFGCAGIFVTTESWLTAKAAPAERGRVFSIYMVGTFLALAVGQLLIARADIKAAAPFNVIVVFFAAALVLVSTARAEPPPMGAAMPLPYGVLTRRAPVAVVGCSLSGVVGGAFYALVPAWMQDQGTARTTIALFMLMAVLGGFAFQIPIGRLSDRFDRRIVLALLGVGFAVTAVVMVLLPRDLSAMLPGALLLGGFMSTLYPVSVAHAHDRMSPDRVVAVSGRLILVNGVGSVFGPLIGAGLMTHLEIDGVFYFMAVATAALALVAGLGALPTRPPALRKPPFRMLTPQAGPLAHDPLGQPNQPSEHQVGGATTT
jgi:MFS family permease